MSGIVDWLFGTARFVPHGVCLLWRPDLVAIHVVSDALIAVAYFAIPLAIYYFVRKRADLQKSHRRMALLFVAFIMTCGFTHIAAIVTLWAPYYGVQALLKAITAAFSVATAAALPFLVPRLLQIPSPETLAAANAQLKVEVGAHQATLKVLEQTRAGLAREVAEKTQDLRVANARFQAALANSQVTLFEQDDGMRYTWVHNPPFGLGPEQMLGVSEAAFMTPETVSRLQALKRQAMLSGEARRDEVEIKTDRGEGWFDVHVEPFTLRDGRPGLIASSTNVTAQKRQQEHLQTVMRELNHRSKNLLAMVQSIARQTARGLDVPERFLVLLAERLKALARTHDVLVQRQWSGADLRQVIEGQVQHQLATFPGRILLEGGPVELPAASAHYLGLAVHELGANAAKYGALAGDSGEVRVSWRTTRSERGETLNLEWRESGGPQVAPPTRSGFGRGLLEGLTPRALHGTATLSFDAEGLVWRLEAPLSPGG